MRGKNWVGNKKGKKKPFLLRGRVLLQKMNRRRPTLPPSFPGSTIGAERLNFRVRNGNGCYTLAMTTEK